MRQEVFVVYTKVDGEFDEVKGVHLSKEEAICECVKWAMRKLEGRDEKLIVSEWGVETTDSSLLAVVITRQIKKGVPH